MKKTLICAAMALTLTACGEQAPAPAPAPPPAPVAAEPAPAAPVAETFEARLDRIVAGEHRSAENKARDAWRHPKETLQFGGVAAGQTVIEITPGGGWYTEILAPLFNGQGSYVAAVNDPTKASSDRAREYHTSNNQKLRDKFAGNAELYGTPSIVEFDAKAPVFGAPGSADIVMTFRNVHNWAGGGSHDAMFKGFFDVLKPGGTLLIEEHRAKADDARPLEELARTGYVTQQWVIDTAVKAGFTLAAESEINANPADTKDHPNGVWNLPPTLDIKEGDDAEKYKAIGESDRMTLKFVKPA
jgi:predicted methyltransferase